MYIFITRICVACAVIAVAFAEIRIPSYVKVCNRKDPEINKCVLNLIEQFRNKLMTGIPELEIPAIEPFLLRHVRLLKGPQTAKLDVNLTNLQVFGISTFKIRDFKIDPENVFATFKLNFNKLDFRGKYKINARILLLNLVGDGDITGTFFGYNADCLLRSHKFVKNNKTYVNFERMKFDIKINKAMFNLDNIFGSDPVLGLASNEVINTNSDLLLEEIKPALEDALSDFFTDATNKLIEKFTYDELFSNS